MHNCSIIALLDSFQQPCILQQSYIERVQLKAAEEFRFWNSEIFIAVYVGTMQTLDARHIELFLSEGYQDGSWEYEVLGSHDIKKHADGASGGIFDIKHIRDPSTSGNFYH